MQEKESNMAFVDMIEKPVPRVTVLHHSAEPRDVKQ